MDNSYKTWNYQSASRENLQTVHIIFLYPKIISSKWFVSTKTKQHTYSVMKATDKANWTQSLCNSNSYCVKAVPLNHSIAYVKFILIQLEEKLNLSCLLRMVNENDAVTIKHVKLAQQIHDKDEKTWYTSRCFIRTATTTFTRTNCAIRTNTTKKTGAMNELTQQLVRHFSEASQSSRSVS